MQCFFYIFGQGDAKKNLKKICIGIGRLSGMNPLALYELPVCEILEWDDVIKDG